MSRLPELTTVRDFIRYAASSFNEVGLFYGHGTDNAWDDAHALIFHTLHLSHHKHAEILDAHITEDERDKMIAVIQKRIVDRIPVPYITHEAWFAGLSFYVDERVLIPRSPIAELIESQFQPWIDLNAVENILDLCTGSGCIGIACAKYFENAKVDATDISKDALSVAKINLLRHEVEDQVTLIESDLFTQIPTHKRYDLIITNPPYVDESDMSSLPAEYLHEPSKALAGGSNGLDLVKNILANASQYLTKNGLLVLEVGNSEIALQNEFPNVGFIWPEFERGGGGVCLIYREELEAANNSLGRSKKR